MSARDQAEPIIERVDPPGEPAHAAQGIDADGVDQQPEQDRDQGLTTLSVLSEPTVVNPKIASAK